MSVLFASEWSWNQALAVTPAHPLIQVVQDAYNRGCVSDDDLRRGALFYRCDAGKELDGNSPVFRDPSLLMSGLIFVTVRDPRPPKQLRAEYFLASKPVGDLIHRLERDLRYGEWSYRALLTTTLLCFGRPLLTQLDQCSDGAVWRILRTGYVELAAREADMAFSGTGTAMARVTTRLFHMNRAPGEAFPFTVEMLAEHCKLSEAEVQSVLDELVSKEIMMPHQSYTTKRIFYYLQKPQSLRGDTH